MWVARSGVTPAPTAEDRLVLAMTILYDVAAASAVPGSSIGVFVLMLLVWPLRLVWMAPAELNTRMS
jgi:hypothetical protein